MTALAEKIIDYHSFPGDYWQNHRQPIAAKNKIIMYARNTESLEDLKKIADEFLQENGGESLGDIDTPSFIRKVSNITLMPPQNFSLSGKQEVIEPDPKISSLFSVLKGVEIPNVRAYAI